MGRSERRDPSHSYYPGDKYLDLIGNGAVRFFRIGFRRLISGRAQLAAFIMEILPDWENHRRQTARGGAS